MDGVDALPTPQPHPPTLSVEEAAAALKTPVGDILHYIRAGDLPHMRVQGTHGVEYRLLPEDVHELRSRLHRTDRVADAGAEHGAVNGAAPAGDTVAAGPGPVASASLQTMLERVTLPLVEANERLLGENARLNELLRNQAELLAKREAECEALRAQLESMPAEIDDLSTRLSALQEELALLRDLREQSAERAYLHAWQRIQRRPWWKHLLD